MTSLTPSIVRIQCGKDTGTGFLVEGGFLITCTHCIKAGKPEFQVADEYGCFIHSIDAGLILSFPAGEGDIALFTLKSHLPKHAIFLRLGAETLSKLNRYETFGFSQDGPTNGVSDNLGQVDSIKNVSESGLPQILLSNWAALDNGFSGAPIFDPEQGTVIGMVQRKGENIAAGLPSSFICTKFPQLKLHPAKSISRASPLDKYAGKVPAAPPAHFQGREEKIAEVRHTLQQHQIAFISGMRGMGKTAVALAYHQKFGAEYNHVAWLDCEPGYLAAFTSGNLAEWLGMQELVKDKEAADRHRLLAAKMASLPDKNLLIADSSNDKEELEKWVNTLPGWHILVTTKTRPERLANSVVDLDSLAPESALQLYFDLFPNSPDSQELVTSYLSGIGWHTLLVELTALSLKKNHAFGQGSLAPFMENLEQHKLLEVQTPGVSVNYRPSPVAITGILKEIFDFSRLDPAEKILLFHFSLFPSRYLSYPDLETLFRPDEEDKQEFQTTLLALRDSGWLDHDEEQGFKAHQLIQETMLSLQPPDAVNCAAYLGILNLLFEESTYLGIRKQFTDVAASFIDKFKTSDQPLTNLCFNLGATFEELGYLHESLSFFTRAAHISEEIKDKENVAACWGRIGDIYQAKGDWEKALNFFTKYLQITEELAATNPHSESLKNGLAISYSKLGEIYQTKGEWEKALDFFTKDLQINEELAAANPHSESLKNGLAISYEKLGGIYQAKGEWEKALDFFTKRSHFGEQLAAANPHSEELKNGLAISYLKLGEIYQANGDWEKALDFFTKQTTLFEQLAAANPHSESLKNGLAISYAKLGEIYQAKGEWEKALDFFTKRSHFGEQLAAANPHSESLKNGLAISYSKLGEIYQANGEWEKALDFFTKDLQINEELAAANPHSESLKNGLAISYSKLGEIHQAKGEWEKALDFFTKQTTLFEQLAAANPHSESLKKGLAISYSKLGGIYQAKGEWEKALDFFTKQTTLFEQLAAANPHSINLKKGYANSLMKLAILHIQIQSPAKDEIRSSILTAKSLFIQLKEKTGYPEFDKKIEGCDHYLSLL